jgi:deoxyribodipyrimidine photo-lyase
MAEPSILWLRRDLRVSDQAALVAACSAGPVVPVYILDDETPRHRAMGGASRWWLHHSLMSMDRALRERGSRLILRRGKSADVLTQLAVELGTRSVHTIYHYEPWWRNAERELGKSLNLHLHHGNYLLPAGTLVNGSGQPYKIYTPFMRALVQHMPPPVPLPTPKSIPTPEVWPDSDNLTHWGLLPSKPNWAKGFAQEWTPGEESAQQRLADFLPHVSRYDHARNMPSQEGSSRLSGHLHFGEISPATIWHALESEGGGEECSTFAKELIWRDYAQNIIVSHPDYGKSNGKAQFDAMPWRSAQDATADIEAWKRGRTGYPIVDAGMRQLWATGWMHNRVRMITASFLIKHLLVDWRVGEQWFWDTLIDADYAQNTVNWQWVAGSGVDANMFVRIMAPLVQSPKFEAEDYIRQWVPELSGIRGMAIHDPEEYGCRPAQYPKKIIAHAAARERALAAHARIKA